MLLMLPLCKIDNPGRLLYRRNAGTGCIVVTRMPDTGVLSLVDPVRADE